MSEEITRTIPVISTDALREIDSFEAALELARETFGGTVAVSDVLSDGFALVEDKRKLINVRFLVVSFSFAVSKERFDENGKGLKYAVVRLVTERNEKLFLTDGSAGIYNQLVNLADRGIYGSILANHGLRMSEYEVVNDKGAKEIARTFYLDTNV